jgi:hypothetical protein
MIYVASSWRNEHQPYVVHLLSEKGHKVYDFRDHGFKWQQIDPDWESWSLHQYVNALMSPQATRGFERDWDAMNMSGAFVLVLPCGASAHLEAGWAAGRDKSVCVFAPESKIAKPELMYRLMYPIISDYSDLLSWAEEVDPA